MKYLIKKIILKIKSFMCSEFQFTFKKIIFNKLTIEKKVGYNFLASNLLCIR
jgi:hypothetical protein